MTKPSTTYSRRFTVDEEQELDVFRTSGGVYRVDPPVNCEPGKHYRADLDLEARTATISEETP